MDIVLKLNNCRLSLAEIFIFSEIVSNAVLISTSSYKFSKAANLFDI
jgi:hypothetical protein